jgi:hypothetical protein
MLDLKGRANFVAWAKIPGMASVEPMKQNVARVVRNAGIVA